MSNFLEKQEVSLLILLLGAKGIWFCFCFISYNGFDKYIHFYCVVVRKLKVASRKGFEFVNAILIGTKVGQLYIKTRQRKLAFKNG